MQFRELEQIFKNKLIFSLDEIKLFEPNFHRYQLNYW
jgi:hypothetical protein